MLDGDESPPPVSPALMSCSLFFSLLPALSIDSFVDPRVLLLFTGTIELALSFAENSRLMADVVWDPREDVRLWLVREVRVPVTGVGMKAGGCVKV